jgi:hypothetical protein
MLHDIPAETLQIRQRLGKDILIVSKKLYQSFLFSLLKAFAYDHYAIWDVVAQGNLLCLLR